jgi:hypothetical protein
MKRSYEESYNSSQDLANGRLKFREPSQYSSLVYILPEDCITTILNILFDQPFYWHYDLSRLEGLDVYENVLKFVCTKLHHICHKKMFLARCQPQQEKIHPFSM